MIHTHRTLHLSVRLLTLYTFLVISLLGCQGVVRVETLDKLPSEEQALDMSATRYSADKPPVITDSLDVALEVRRNYDFILARREQLEISVEVKGHFEKAVKQAEKKLDAGDEDISSSSITKLKLGLAGTLNDISGYSSDIASRASISSISIFFITGGILLYFVDEKKGREELKYLEGSG